MKKVLFVCIGNVCRSPMAEAFANHYGNDVLIAKSAGWLLYLKLCRKRGQSWKRSM